MNDYKFPSEEFFAQLFMGLAGVIWLAAAVLDMSPAIRGLTLVAGGLSAGLGMFILWREIRGR